MPSSAVKALLTFIDEIPEEKLASFPNTEKNIVNDRKNFHLDMQGRTTEDHRYNLQIQVNKPPELSTLKSLQGQTVSGPVLVDPNNPLSPEEIRQLFRDRIVKQQTVADRRQQKKEKKEKQAEEIKEQRQKDEAAAETKRKGNKKHRR